MKVYIKINQLLKISAITLSAFLLSGCDSSDNEVDTKSNEFLICKTVEYRKNVFRHILNDPNKSGEIFTYGSQTIGKVSFNTGLVEIISTFSDNAISFLAVDDSNSEHLAVYTNESIIVSMDSGKTWSDPVSLGISDIYNMKFSSDGKYLYCFSFDGSRAIVYGDGSGLVEETNGYSSSLLIAPDKANQLYFIESGDIVVSKDYGFNVENVVFPDNYTPDYGLDSGFTVNYNNSNTLLSLGSKKLNAYDYESVLIRSTDGGNTWETLDSNLSKLSIKFIQNAKNSGTDLYILGQLNDLDHKIYIYISKDNGLTWSKGYASNYRSGSSGANTKEPISGQFNDKGAFYYYNFGSKFMACNYD